MPKIHTSQELQIDISSFQRKVAASVESIWSISVSVSFNFHFSFKTGEPIMVQ